MGDLWKEADILWLIWAKPLKGHISRHLRRLKIGQDFGWGHPEFNTWDDDTFEKKLRKKTDSRVVGGEN